MPEIVNVSVNTPYPGTESFLTESHAVTRRLSALRHSARGAANQAAARGILPGAGIDTQVLNKKQLGFAALKTLTFTVAKLLAQGQTNFARSLFLFHKVYDARLRTGRPQATGPL